MDVLLSSQVLIPLTVFGVAIFIGTVIAIPFLLVRLPPDYFQDHNPRVWMTDSHPVLRGAWIVVKNILGAGLLAAGFAMLFLPGQGLLTMLIGLSLMDFPGKRQLERKLIGQPGVLRTINRLRAKFGKPPLVVDEK